MLIKEADRRRAAAGMNHQSFAAALDISPQLWSLTRSGRKPPRGKVIAAIVRLYPDLRPLALEEMARFVIDGHDRADRPTPAQVA